MDSIEEGTECGIGLEAFEDFQSGDVVECYVVEEKRGIEEANAKLMQQHQESQVPSPAPIAVEGNGIDCTLRARCAVKRGN